MKQQERNQAGILDVDDGGLPAYSEDGVDLTLIRSMLRKTPSERLQELMAHLNFVLAVRQNSARR